MSERKLLVELTVETNIESNAALRGLLHSGLDGMLIQDMKDGQFRVIEILDIEGIDRRDDE